MPLEIVCTKARQEGGFPQMWMGFFMSAEAVFWLLQEPYPVGRVKSLLYRSS